MLDNILIFSPHAELVAAVIAAATNSAAELRPEPFTRSDGSAGRCWVVSGSPTWRIVEGNVVLPAALTFAVEDLRTFGDRLLELLPMLEAAGASFELPADIPGTARVFLPGLTVSVAQLQ